MHASCNCIFVIQAFWKFKILQFFNRRQATIVAFALLMGHGLATLPNQVFWISLLSISCEWNGVPCCDDVMVCTEICEISQLVWICVNMCGVYGFQFFEFIWLLLTESSIAPNLNFPTSGDAPAEFDGAPAGSKSRHPPPPSSRTQTSILAYLLIIYESSFGSIKTANYVMTYSWKMTHFGVWKNTHVEKSDASKN